MKTVSYNVDLAVIGGGVAGVCAALAAARNGAQVVLMQDRPVLGGNASSEIRMWICGAGNTEPLMRESGIIEELLLENLHRNPDGNYSLWDSVMYGKVRYQKNLTLLLNTSCMSAEMNGDKIESVRGWQLTSETYHEVHAKYFADCSGDSILAALSGAETRYGRESSQEFGEDIAPAEADRRTMGMSCLIQARETREPHEYIAPEWAEKYTSLEQLQNRHPFPEGLQNYWWIELGGNGDALHDVDFYRDKLLRRALGIWDLVKNHPSTHDKYLNWELEWLGFLPGKRESRRYVGDVVVNQNDVRAEGKFDDIVAYGGWSMDDHHPDGMDYPGQPTIFHPAPSPYGIPYRALYSRNVANLFCAGRNISVTHSALSSTRVMATCGLLGHAVGVAAALATRYGVMPWGIYESHISELQQQLMREDAYIPGMRYEVSEAVSGAKLTASSGDPSGLRKGLNRVLPNEDESWLAPLGSAVTYTWEAAYRVETVRVVFDSKLERTEKNIIALRRLDTPRYALPETLVKSFRLEYRTAKGEWEELLTVDNNSNRVAEYEVGKDATGLRLTTLSSYGATEVKTFAFDFR